MESRIEEIHCPGCNQSFKKHISYAISVSHRTVDVKAYWTDESFATIDPVVYQFKPIDLELYCPRCGKLEYDTVYVNGSQYPKLVITGARRRQ